MIVDGGGRLAGLYSDLVAVGTRVRIPPSALKNLLRLLLKLVSMSIVNKEISLFEKAKNAVNSIGTSSNDMQEVETGRSTDVKTLKRDAMAIKRDINDAERALNQGNHNKARKDIKDIKRRLKELRGLIESEKTALKRENDDLSKLMDAEQELEHVEEALEELESSI